MIYKKVISLHEPGWTAMRTSLNNGRPSVFWDARQPRGGEANRHTIVSSFQNASELVVLMMFG